MGVFELFDERQIASLRLGGTILRDCLAHVSALVSPGVTTGELDMAAEAFIRSHDAEPGFKGYQGYPATLCTSVNEECVHGLPGNRLLREGDIISIDCGVLFDGLYTDSCVTVSVGKIPAEAQKLISVTMKALREAEKVLRAGVAIGDISLKIEQTVEKEGFHPVRKLTGHGLGSALHQFPDIPNSGVKGKGPIIPVGTILAIEPIVSAGSSIVKEKGDGWTLVIEDGALSAHFEHTVLVEQNGCSILT